MLNTILSRYNYMIEERKRNISLMGDILSGKNRKYKYNLMAVEEELMSEKQCLNELLTDDFYSNMIEDEKQKTKEQFCL